MRARIAAACAAVLVGLAPAVPLSSFAVVVACATADAGVSAPSGKAGGSNELPAGALSRSGPSAHRPAGERAPAIWRDPSAPAPSQAPPAARA
jgi:hypothetical protein